MFDGNHRSRRPINLSGSSRRRKVATAESTSTTISGTTPISMSSGVTDPTSSSSSSRQGILEQSRRLRQERYLVQVRNKAAVCVQRVYRGRECRKRMSRELDQRLLLLDDGCCPSLVERTRVLNFRLAFPIRDEEAHYYIEDFGKRIETSSSSATSTTAGAVPEKDDPPPLLCHRILWTVFRLVRRGMHLSACTFVLRYCLKPPLSAPSSSASFESATNTSSTSSIQRYYWKQLGGVIGYVDLLETLQFLGRANTTTTSSSSSSSSNDAILLLRNDLWEWVAAVTPRNLSGKAALAALVLSQRNLFLNDQESFLAAGTETSETTIPTTTTSNNFINALARRLVGGNESCSSTGSDVTTGTADNLSNTWSLFYQEWFFSLVRVLQLPCDSSAATSTEDPMVVAARRIESTAQVIILSNALDLYYMLSKNNANTNSNSNRKPDPAPILRLLQRVLEKRSNLALLASLFARGEDLQSTTSSMNAPEVEERRGQDDVDDDDTSDSDDDDNDMETAHSARASSSAVAARVRVGARLTKQDLLTTPKIDRNYHSEVSKWRTQVLTDLNNTSTSSSQQQTQSTEREDVIRLAMQICNGEQWLTWGLALLSASQDSEELWLAQEAYVTLLACMLQSTTGLRALQSARSTLLTKLAFHQEFVEKLWRYVLVQLTNKDPSSRNTYVAFSVFSDIFTHRLIALKDDKFLVDHTTMQGPRVILAEHVIVRLRDLLYELYWNKPVRAGDVKVPFGRSLSEGERFEAVRGRAMLTGTKLFQALYERWCRLVRHAPFCDESTWIFPHMPMAGNENSVVGMNHHHHQGGDDEMDVDSDSDADGDEQMSTFDAEIEGLADAFSDPKMARILTCIPQVLPFDRRVKLFSTLLAKDKLRTQDEAAEVHRTLRAMMNGEEGELFGRERVAIRRDRLYDDSMKQLNKLGTKLKRKVQVTFINQHGAQEAGIDGGGVFKEFIDDLIKEGFSLEGSSNRPLFTVTPLQMLAVNPGLTRDTDMLLHYEFLGRVLGKAVYESILVEPQFCLPFLNQLLGKVNYLEDLKNYDFEYYKNLIKLEKMTSDEVNSVGLAFDLTIGEGSSSRTVELVPGGRRKPVTKQNVIQYVHLVARQRLNVESAAQTKAFLRGFRDLIPASWVRLFSAYELQKLIGGDDAIRGIDVSALKTAMRYAAGYHPSQPIIQWFWEILDDMTAEEQRKFLKFVTSCSRQPLLGFASLDPPPCIQQIRLPDEILQGDRAKSAPLPTSSTCMNLLKLPNYKDKELMRAKLLTAINSGAGFELT